MMLYWLMRLIVKVVARVFFQLRVEGAENLPPKENFILAANHTSALDPFVIMAAIPRYIRWMVIYEFYDRWYLQWILRRLRFIRVENNLPREALAALLNGEIVGLFPEGRRSWDGHLGKARRGVASLARRTSRAVVPVAVLGTFAALPRTRLLPRPHPVTVRIGVPLSFSSFPDKKGEIERIDAHNTARIMQSIAELLQKQ